MSNETIGPKSECQKTGGSTSEYLTIKPNEICPKSNLQEHRGSQSDRLTLILNDICYMHTQNKIVTPFIDNTHETEIAKKCNGLHQNT